MHSSLSASPATLFHHVKKQSASHGRHPLKPFTIDQSKTLRQSQRPNWPHNTPNYTSSQQTDEKNQTAHCRINHPADQFSAGLFATGRVEDEDEDEEGAVLGERLVTSTGAILIGFPSSRSVISAPVRVSCLMRAFARRSRSRRLVCRQAHARW